MTTQTGAVRAARNLELVRAGYDDFGRGDPMELTRGTFRVTVTEGYASPGGVAVMVRSQAERDGRVLDDRQMHVFTLSGDRVVEVWQFVGDGARADEFWS